MPALAISSTKEVASNARLAPAALAGDHCVLAIVSPFRGGMHGGQFESGIRQCPESTVLRGRSWGRPRRQDSAGAQRRGECRWRSRLPPNRQLPVEWHRPDSLVPPQTTLSG